MDMSLRKTRLELERLEDRCTPATWGNPWPDPGHLTLSFAPDGTQNGSGQSKLFQTLNALAPTQTWQTEILRAFQTWAVQANINIGVVADQGASLGSTGVIQGDSRFGDIRLAAFPYSSTSEAIASPFELDAGTWSGDVQLNSTTSYTVAGQGTGYDLFSVALHEAGHVFGLDDNNNPASVMDASYLGSRSSLGTADIAALQAIYGMRTPDPANNEQMSTATKLSLLTNADGSLGATVNADVASLQDRDFYSFNTLLNSGGVNVILRTGGISLLTPRVTVYDSSGQTVVSTTTADPLPGGFVIHLSNVRPLSTYYVAVQSGQQNVFGIGSYQLTVHELPLVNSLFGAVTATVTQGVNDTTTFLSNTVALNTSFATAMSLQPQASSGGAASDYAYRGAISSGSEGNYFKVQAPANLSSTSVLTAMVWGLDSLANNGLDPRVRVFDAQQNPVAAEVLVNDHGSYTIQIHQPISQAMYYVEVVAANPKGSNDTGKYFLGVDFTSRGIALQNFVAGSIPASGPTRATLNLTQNQLFHFVLTCNTPGYTGSAGVQMTIVNSSGAIVFALTAGNNEPVSGNIILTPETYTVLFTATATTGGSPPQMNFVLQGSTPSNPIGPEPTDPNSYPDGSQYPYSNSNYYTWNGGSSSGVQPSSPSSSPYSGTPPSGSSSSGSYSGTPPSSSGTSSGSGSSSYPGPDGSGTTPGGSPSPSPSSPSSGTTS
ncbi:MAG: hypothetical protein C5B46_03320 [Proteobacteria bacterium]|nr:MAG: hypothetical protein C5B46_03320 [Pseudomonadota bacterium]